MLREDILKGLTELLSISGKELRVCQIISNLCRSNTGEYDIFFIDDKELLNYISKEIDRVNNDKK